MEKFSVKSYISLRNCQLHIVVGGTKKYRLFYLDQNPAPTLPTMHLNRRILYI